MQYAHKMSSWNNTTEGMMNLVRLAAEGGDVDQLSQYDRCVDSVTKCAARYNQTDTLARLHALGFQLTGDEYTHAAKNNSAEMMEWLIQNNAPIKPESMCHHARHGNLPMMQRIVDNGLQVDYHVILESLILAIRHGHLNVAQWLPAAGGDMYSAKMERDVLAEAMTEAVTHGQLGAAQWLREIGGALSGDLCALAAEHGHLRMLAWMLENGAPLKPSVIVKAIQHGHAAIAEYLLGLGAEYVNDLRAATRYADLECRDSQACTSAAWHGNLHILQMLISRGFAVNVEFALRSAEAKGHHDIVEFLRREYGVLGACDPVVRVCGSDSPCSDQRVPTAPGDGPRSYFSPAPGLRGRTARMLNLNTHNTAHVPALSKWRALTTPPRSCRATPRPRATGGTPRPWTTSR